MKLEQALAIVHQMAEDSVNGNGTETQNAALNEVASLRINLASAAIQLQHIARRAAEAKRRAA